MFRDVGAFLVHFICNATSSYLFLWSEPPSVSYFEVLLTTDLCKQRRENEARIWHESPQNHPLRSVILRHNCRIQDPILDAVSVLLWNALMLVGCWLSSRLFAWSHDLRCIICGCFDWCLSENYPMEILQCEVCFVLWNRAMLEVYIKNVNWFLTS